MSRPALDLRCMLAALRLLLPRHGHLGLDPTLFRTVVSLETSIGRFATPWYVAFRHRPSFHHPLVHPPGSLSRTSPRHLRIPSFFLPLYTSIAFPSLQARMDGASHHPTFERGAYVPALLSEGPSPHLPPFSTPPRARFLHGPIPHTRPLLSFHLSESTSRDEDGRGSPDGLSPLASRGSS